MSEVIEYYRHLFAGRLDAYSRWVVGPDEKNPLGWRPVREELTAEIVEAGLTKQGPAISGFFIAPGDVTHIAAMDFDLDEGAMLAKRVIATMAKQGAPAYFEGSRRGAHVWILLETQRPVKQVRAALQAWCMDAGMPTDPGDPARGRAPNPGLVHPKIELRPATDSIGVDGLGHALRLPLMPHPKTGQRGKMVDPDGTVLGPKLPQILVALDTVPDAVLARAALRWVPKVTPDRVPMSYRTPKARTDDDDSSASELLRTLWGVLDAAPGKVVSCPAKQYHSHGDIHKGCKIFPDDKRVLCHKPGCILNNNEKGLGTYQLRTMAPVPA